MRAFYVACTILLSVVILVICCSFAVLHCTDEMLSLCREIASDSSQAALTDLYAAWLDCRNFLSLSVQMDEISHAESSLLSMIAARHDPVARDTHLRIFTAALRRIADGCRFDLFSML